jgi:hypothetical protein
VVRSDAVDAEHAEGGRKRQIGLLDLALDRGGIDVGPLLPAEQAGHRRADRKRRIVRLGHATGGESTHHAADWNRLGVVRDRADPAAHRRLDRQPFVAHPHLAGREREQRR